jgi:hypothetical protein
VSRPQPRPLLLLDVDGVLLPVRDNNVPGGYYQASADFRSVPMRQWESGAIADIWVSSANTDRLRLLADRFEIVWATGWRHHANEIIAPLHELPDLPVIELTWSENLRSLETSWKLPEISEYVRERPCVWIDDQVRDDIERWAHDREAPTLVLHADHRTGLSDELVDRALSFADAVDRSRRGR